MQRLHSGCRASQTEPSRTLSVICTGRDVTEAAAAADAAQQLEGTGGGAPWFEYAMTDLRCALRKQGRVQVQVIDAERKTLTNTPPAGSASIGCQPAAMPSIVLMSSLISCCSGRARRAADPLQHQACSAARPVPRPQHRFTPSRASSSCCRY
jgi:hypothetical protein